MDSYNKALSFDPNNPESVDGIAKTRNAIAQGQFASGDNDEERLRHAYADPEIRQIMTDPNMQLILQKMQQDPSYGMSAMKDPDIAKKIERLIQAGVIKTGR